MGATADRRAVHEDPGELHVENSIHLGTEYAALLVERDFSPPDTTDSLPQSGGPVLAVATMKGTGEYTQPPPKTLAFSGYEWEVRQIPSDRGGQNDYDPANAWTDSAGHLHLRLAMRDNHWTSAEVILSRALGYGTYVFTVRDTSSLDPSAALGMLTWDDQGPPRTIVSWISRSVNGAIAAFPMPNSFFSRSTCPRMWRVFGAARYAHAFVPLAAGPRVIQDDTRQQSDGG